MIHHVSIPARDPRHVAEVLGELMDGKRSGIMGDAEAVRLMRATHLKEPA